MIALQCLVVVSEAGFVLGREFQEISDRIARQSQKQGVQLKGSRGNVGRNHHYRHRELFNLVASDIQIA